MYATLDAKRRQSPLREKVASVKEARGPGLEEALTYFKLGIV